MKKILLLATGGTIASRPTAAGGLAPAITSEELLACAWWMPATLIPKRPAARCGGKLYKQSLMRYNIVYGYTLHKIA